MYVLILIEGLFCFWTGHRYNAAITIQANNIPQFITGSAAKQLAAGDFVQVPILQGTNFDEGTSFGGKGINTTEQFLTVIESGGPNATVAQTFALLYPDIPGVGIPATLPGRPSGNYSFLGSQYKRASAYGGDLAMQAPRRATSQAWAAQNVSSWSYHFNVVPNGVAPQFGVPHFQEVAFVFRNLLGQGYNNSVAVDPFANRPQSYDKVATMMSGMWATFIATGDPNSGNGTLCICRSAASAWLSLPRLTYLLF